MTRIANNQPARGMAVSNRDSTGFQLHAWDVPSGTLRRLTDRPAGTDEGWIAPDGRHVYFLDDQQGNDMGHIVRLPYEGGPAEDVTPDLPPYTLRGFGFSASGNRLACNPVNADGYQLYVIDLGPDGWLGSPRRIYQTEREAWLALLSADGALAAMISTERAGGLRHYSLLVFDVTTGAQVGELWDGPEASVEAVRFSPVAGDPRILATTTRGGFTRPLIWNPRSGERIDLELGELEGEVSPADWSPDARELLLCQIHRAEQQLYLYDHPGACLTRLQHPSGTFFFPGYGGAYFTPAGELFSPWEDSAHPADLVELDRHTGAVKRTVLAAGEAVPGHPWRSVTFSSSGGQEVQAWLAVPDGMGPFPTVVEVHGGPHFAVMNTFSPFSQAWLDHGFAYLSVNYRGSTTFGRAFKEQIWGDIGHWELEDIVAARHWLVEQGIARPDAVILSGASYGGFLTLWGLSQQPDLWAAGIALVAIADWVVNFEDASEALRGAFTAWFGGTPAEKRDLYIARSPITYAEQVKAPLLVIQGRNDSRTTARQIALYETKMRMLGKNIELDWFDAGHDLADIELIIGFQARMLGSADRVLGAYSP